MIIAPIATTVTCGAPPARRRMYAPATTCFLRRSRAAASSGTDAKVWSTGRVESRTYDDEPSGRPNQTDA